ncbi:YncE family protein [Hymenobacter humi]|uniref:YncE family protein n=1 Tax=Hymenobacter humi TaxID=1411620 RepID=A0ABW2UEJ2_9BACT
MSPFSPNIFPTRDGQQIWFTHKDVGKVSVLDTKTLTISGVLTTGPISNHVATVDVAAGKLAYVTVGGEDVVKVYSRAPGFKQLATIPVGALPHGIWPSGDGSRVYVGLENGDSAVAISTASNKVLAKIKVGQAPMALMYVPNAVPAGAAGATGLGRQPGGPARHRPHLEATYARPRHRHHDPALGRAGGFGHFRPARPDAQHRLRHLPDQRHQGTLPP